MRNRRYGWVFAAVWLVYLNENLSVLLARPDDWPRDVGLAALAGFAALYLLLVGWLAQPRLEDQLEREKQPREKAQQRLRKGQGRRRSLLRYWAMLLGLLGLAALQVPGAGNHALTCLVYVAAGAMVGLPLWQAVPFAAALLAAAELLAWRVPGWDDQGYGLAVLLGSVASGGFRLAAERQRRLRSAQDELAAIQQREHAEVAVADERARIAADLHDILGHSLTVVTVKAELAQRLLDVDVDKARAELRDLEVLARDALSDVRATALGVRGISLPGEIAAAREALAAAHMSAQLPGATDAVPTRNRELFAWTIREAVTNVVRHSRAARCEVRLAPGSVEIVDDGPGDGAPAPDGQGLRGLRRRADAAGATLTVGHREGQAGFLVRVEVPS
jgi:two-component system sensor histidine kinase DesK